MSRPSTIEDYLVSVKNGQWFGFKNLNGNDANKTYANLIVHDGSDKPSESDCVNGLKALQDAWDAEQTKKTTDETSGKTKLKNLGLSDDEIKALTGK
tara:strand:+ start:116 stop:406 length:291 start_codon:yes stop_codon:yes gene_type:complete